MRVRRALARRRHIKHAAVVASFILRVIGFLAVFGVIGAAGALDLGGHIAAGVRTILLSLAVAAAGILGGEMIERVNDNF